jgi:hypothetical protein
LQVTVGSGTTWRIRLATTSIGTSVEEVICGNVVGIDDGSESPIAPFNFIEFAGTGFALSTDGGEAIPITFSGRVEDRNEPGNSQSDRSADGDATDRFFLRVQTYDREGLYLVSGDQSPDVVEPVAITQDNFQIHPPNNGGNFPD